jgi:hypothetical protein
MRLFGGRSRLHSLVRREAVLHLHDGETSIRGFLLDFYDDGSVLVAKPVLEAPNAKDNAALAGEALVFSDQIKFIQLLGR